MKIISWCKKKVYPIITIMLFSFISGIRNIYLKISNKHLDKFSDSCLFLVMAVYRLYKKYYHKVDAELGVVREKLLSNWPADYDILLLLDKLQGNCYEAKRKIIAEIVLGIDPKKNVLAIDEENALDSLENKLLYTFEMLRLEFEIQCIANRYKDANGIFDVNKIDKYHARLDKYNAKLDKYDEHERIDDEILSDLQSLVNKIQVSMDKEEELIRANQEGIDRLSAGIAQLDVGIAEAQEGIEEMDAGIKRNQEGIERLNAGIIRRDASIALRDV